MVKLSPVMLAAAAAAGVYASAQIGMYIPLFSAAAIAAAAAVLSARKHRVQGGLYALAAVFAAGAISCALHSGSVMHKTVDYIGRYVTVHGVVLTQAQESAYSDNYKYTVRVWAVDKNGSIEKMNDDMLLTTPALFSCGDSVMLKGIIKDMPSQMNENGFDTAKYYRAQGIFTRMYTEETGPGGDATVLSPLILTGKFREAVDSVIYKYYTGDGAAVLSAVLTGNTHHFSEEFNTILSETSFKRLYHPAYLHIFIISSLIGILSGLIPRRGRDAAAAAILIAYALFNCAGAGFLRCLLTAALTMLMRARNGSSYYPDVIGRLVAVCAVIMPLMLFDAAFIMSVSAGILIWAFMPRLSKALSFLPRGVRHTASVLIICSLFQLPLTAYYFNGICIYSLLAPFIMGPLVLMTLITAPVTLLVLSIADGAFLLKAYLDMMLWAMIRLPRLIESMPFSNTVIPTPSVSVMAACLFGTAAIYYYVNKRGKWAAYAFSAAAGMTAAAVTVSLSRLGTADFTFVNVGQGDGAVIHKYLGETILIDGGGGSSYSDYDPGESVFVPYLESKGYGNIDAAFVSHYHKDHVQGIIAAVETLDVNTVFVPPYDSCVDDDMRMWAEELRNAAEANGTEVLEISEDKRISFKGGTVLSVYVPDAVLGISGDGNDTSLLIKAEYGDTSCLYTGDMTSFAEKCRLDAGIDVQADILKVAHHGSGGSSREEFIEAVSPEYSVISCGEDNPYGHPRADTLERLSGTGILRTDLNGTITITADEDEITKVSVLKR